jgi:hypothetical protein
MSDVVITRDKKILCPIHGRAVGNPFRVVVEQSVVITPIPDNRASSSATRAEPLRRCDRPHPIAEPGSGVNDEVFEHTIRGDIAPEIRIRSRQTRTVQVKTRLCVKQFLVLADYSRAFTSHVDKKQHSHLGEYGILKLRNNTLREHV